MPARDSVSVTANEMKAAGNCSLGINQLRLEKLQRIRSVVSAIEGQYLDREKGVKLL